MDIISHYRSKAERVHRALTHEKEIREFVINGQRMHIGGRFRNVTGTLAGNPPQVGFEELEKLDRLLPE